MAVEVEAKMPIDDPAPVMAALKAAGATPLGQWLETNTFLDTEDRKLLAGDQGLRLRAARDISTGQIRCIITHKGADRYGPLKQREETELVVEDGDGAIQLLEKLGFVRTLTFQKRRESWELGGCRIELDEVPLLGRFVEIEGPDEPTIMRVREKLGLSQRPLIKTSYIAMIVSHLQERGDRRAVVVFPPES